MQSDKANCRLVPDSPQGISLSIEQYNALLAAAPLLESVLNKKDVHVARPNYDADPNTTEGTKDAGEEQHVTTVNDDDEEAEE